MAWSSKSAADIMPLLETLTRIKSRDSEREDRRSVVITSMNHTGFVVRDLGKSVEFYRDVIGLELVRMLERDGPGISQVLGYEQTHIRGALLGIADGHFLELIQYHHPEGADRQSEERNMLGATHLAFNVDDIEATLDRLVSSGARKLNPPAEVGPQRTVCYLQDPDGNWIELIEDTN